MSAMLHVLKTLTDHPHKHLLLFDDSTHPLFLNHGMALLKSGYSIGPIDTNIKSLLPLKESRLPGVYLTDAAVESPSLLCFSSGSQNHQKGIVRSFESWKKSFQLIADEISENPHLRGIVLGALPYSLTLFGVMESLFRGVTPLLLPNHNVRYLTQLKPATEGLLWLTPFHCSFYIQAFNDNRIPALLQIKFVFVGGAYFSVQQRKALQKVFPEAKIYSFYGTSETSFISLKSPSDTSSSVGSVCKGVTIDIRDDDQKSLPYNQTGRLWVKSQQRFSFYFNKEHSIPILNESIGLHDRGYVDNQGRLFFSGRKEQMISIRGHVLDIQLLERWYKTFLNEENLVLLPTSHAQKENSLILFSQKEISPQQWQQLKADALKSLGPQSVPKSSIFCVEWPLLANGKTDRKQLLTLIQ